VAAGPAFADEGEQPPRDAHQDETASVLHDLDRLQQEVRRPGSVPAEVSVSVPPEADPPVRESISPVIAAPPDDEESRVDLGESPTSYLEERLRLADAAAFEIGQDVRTIAATWARVTERIGVLETEVAKANEEMGFIRSSGRTKAAPAPELPRIPVPAARRARAEPSGPSAPYAAFTADRYNRTIAALKLRRRRLAGWTLLSAGLISLALVTLTALTQEPLPPLWLALLPAVWMIPVPFFLLSFRGTQRVLRHNHLEVPPGEAL
jgi:hypothetical protein